MPRTAASLRVPLVLMAAGFSAGVAPAQVSLNTELTPYLAKYDLPALAAAVVKDGKVVAVGAVGTRKAGAMIPVAPDDRFHIGSDTKAMTALLAAMLVEEKKIRWDTTVAEAFPELAKTMDARMKTVTLEQLLSHTSGIPGDNKAFEDLIGEVMLQDGNLDELRYWLVGKWVPLPLAAEPGKAWAYANMGYTLAGAMIERAAGKPWEQLVTERIFIPMGLKTAGLGCQASLGKTDAPLGHKIVDGKVKTFLAGPNGDGPLVLGPAGLVHMSVGDFATWAGWHAGEGKRGPALVRPEMFKKLHGMVMATPEKLKPKPGTPARGKYGMGWGEVVMEWAPEPLLLHGGSNTMNLAHVWVDPKRDLAIVTMTNMGGEKAEEALFQLAPALYAKFAPAK